MSKKHFRLLNGFSAFLVFVGSISSCGCGGINQAPARTEATLQTAGTSSVSLSLSPVSGTIATGQGIEFISPFGAFPVQWSVNGIPGGNLSVGTVDEKGNYTAPSLPPIGSVVLSASLADASDDPGALSAVSTITVVNPIPAVAQLAPNAIPLGTSQAQVSVTGTGFNPNSKVLVNGQVAMSHFVDSTQLTVDVPAAILANAGVWTVTVVNEAPGGGSSDLSLSVLNPAPILSQISPPSVIAKSSDLTVTLSGSGFVPGSQILMNGQVLSTTYLNGGQISVVLPSSSLANAEYTSLSVKNGGPGGGTSAASTFAVLNPQPGLDAVSPAFAFAGTGPVTLTLSGAGYMPQSTVMANGQAVPSSLDGNNSLLITISPEMLNSAGQIALEVTNAGPGGGASPLKALTVLADGQTSNTGNPQVASYLVTIPETGQASVGFGQQDYSLNTSWVSAPLGGGQARVLVAGMKPNTEYHMRASLRLVDGSTITDVDHTFVTQALPPSSTPQFTVTQFDSHRVTPGVQVLDCLNSFGGAPVSLYASDMDGNLVWSYLASVEEAEFPAKLLDNGDFVLGVNGINGIVENSIREINLAGETVLEIPLSQVQAAVNAAGYSFTLNALHHDLLKLENGHYIVLANTYQTVPATGSLPTAILGDLVLDLDRSFNVVWLWNSFDYLDSNRRPVDPVDWTHSNALFYLQQDGSLLLSMRHQSWVLKINYQDGKGDGRILWKLGEQGDFSLAGGTDPVDWFYYQHDSNALSYDGNQLQLLVFDNGDDRIMDSQRDICGSAGQIGCYSRAVLLSIDEASKQATLEFAQNLGLYSGWGGSIQQFSNGNFVAGMTSTPFGSRTVELASDGTLLWQLDVLEQNAYRSLRLPSLYPGVQWP